MSATKIETGNVLLTVPRERVEQISRAAIEPGAPAGVRPLAWVVARVELPNIVAESATWEMFEAWYVECDNGCRGDDACDACPPDRGAVKARVIVRASGVDLDEVKQPRESDLRDMAENLLRQIGEYVPPTHEVDCIEFDSDLGGFRVTCRRRPEGGAADIADILDLSVANGQWEAIREALEAEETSSTAPEPTGDEPGRYAALRQALLAYISEHEGMELTETATALLRAVEDVLEAEESDGRLMPVEAVGYADDEYIQCAACKSLFHLLGKGCAQCMGNGASTASEADGFFGCGSRRTVSADVEQSFGAHWTPSEDVAEESGAQFDPSSPVLEAHGSDGHRPLLVWRFDDSAELKSIEHRFQELVQIAERRGWDLLSVGPETEDLVLEGRSLLKDAVAEEGEPRTCLVHDCDAPATTGGPGKPYCEKHKDLAWPTVDAYREFADLSNKLRSLSQGERFLDPMLDALRFLMFDFEARNLDAKRAAIREHADDKAGDTDEQ